MNRDEKCILLLREALTPAPHETDSLDWKLKLGQKPQKFLKHLSAFSNTQRGGYIVFGIEDKTGSVVGISSENSKNTVETLSNLCRDSIRPPITIEAFSFSFNSKTLLGVFIAESSDRPVHIYTNNRIGDPFIRTGGTSRPMTRDEIREAYQTSRPMRFEELPASLPEEIKNDWERFFEFSEVISRLNAQEFSSKELLHVFLKSNKLLTDQYGKLVPTNLAVLCCAKNFSQIPSCEKYGVRLIEYRGSNKLNAVRDEMFNSGHTITLDSLVERIINIIPHSEVIEQATRVNRPIIPKVAIREIIVNAIIHRNFATTNSSICVEVYEDRVEITNPGSLLPDMSIDRLIDHPSKTRNEVLADFMRKLNFAEERGSGIDKAVFACEVYGLPPIKFINDRDYFRAILYTPKGFNSMSKDERIDAVYQHCCLGQVMSKKTNNSSIRERFKFTEKQKTKVYRLIKDCIAAGKIKVADPSDSAKNTHYVPYWL